MLPSLPEATRWEVELPSEGVGGVCVSNGRVIVGSRDASDLRDVFQSLDAKTGKRIWQYEYNAPANLDYGNSPRATPISRDGVVVTLGATGVVSALDTETGVLLWKASLAKQFSATTPDWGFSSSPIIHKGTVIVSPGASRASVVAFDLLSGKLLWSSPGARSVYASPMVIERENSSWLVGLDAEGGYARDACNGNILHQWKCTDRRDFGVPSPVQTPEGVLFSSEARGLQLFDLNDKSLSMKPIAMANEIVPDSHTPVAIHDQLLVAFEGIRSLSLTDSVTDYLTENWNVDDPSLYQYASIIATQDRALVTCENGNILLIQFTKTDAEIVGRWDFKVNRLLSHPAIVGETLFVRSGRKLRCMDLQAQLSSQ